MSNALDLINGLSEEEIQSRILDYEREGHIIIDDDRRISVPAELQRIAVQYDHNIETVMFDCPRYWDGIDMSEMAVFINYMRNDGVKGSYMVDDVTIDEEDETIMHFTWTVSGHATQVIGELCFIVCIKKLDEAGTELIHWNTELNQDLYISEGLECNEQISDKFPDVITQMLLAIDTVKTVDRTLGEFGKEITDMSNKIVQMERDVSEVVLSTSALKVIYIEGVIPIEAGDAEGLANGTVEPERHSGWRYVSDDKLYPYHYYYELNVDSDQSMLYCPTVIFDVETATSGNFAPVAKFDGVSYGSNSSEYAQIITLYARKPLAGYIATIRLEAADINRAIGSTNSATGSGGVNYNGIDFLISGTFEEVV